MSKIRLIFLIILIPAGYFQCNSNYPIPEVPVYMPLELDLPIYLQLNSVGNSMLFPNEGYKGIIVTRVEFDKFAAYDAACTYDPDHTYGRVALSKTSGLIAVDTVCGSSFILTLDAMPQDGPASIPLKPYVADYNPNTNFLLIHN